MLFPVLDSPALPPAKPDRQVITGAMVPKFTPAQNSIRITHPRGDAQTPVTNFPIFATGI